MRIGTKSILFGGHQFLIHPWFVAWAWWKLYGFPSKIQYWAAFFLHDLGYWGKPNMDGAEGETHVEFGAKVMERVFGKEWGDFCRYHSRFYAKKDKQPFSRLCVADKLAIVLTPPRLYLILTNLTGEINEYMALAQARREEEEPFFQGKYVAMNIYSPIQQEWYANVQEYLCRWVEEHKDGREDTWTPTA